MFRLFDHIIASIVFLFSKYYGGFCINSSRIYGNLFAFVVFCCMFLMPDFK